MLIEGLFCADGIDDAVNGINRPLMRVIIPLSGAMVTQPLIKRFRRSRFIEI